MKKLLLSLVSIFFLNACQMEIEVEIPQKPPQLVVVSTMVPYKPNGKYLGVEVFTSRHLFDETENLPVENASVFAFRNGQSFGQLSYLTNNNYNFYPFGYAPLEGPLPGETYRIEVSVPGFNPVWAETTIPQPVEIIQWNLDRIGFFDENGLIYSRVSLLFNDPPGQKNFYEIVVTDVSCQYDANCYSKVVTFEPFITSEPHYPSPVMVHLPKPNRLLFTNQTFQGEQCNINFYYFPGQEVSPGSHITLTGGFIAIQLRHVTEEYYKHFSTMLQARNQRLEDPFHGMGEPINIYSNITNGLGVFAGFNNSVVEVQLNDLEVF